MTVSCVKLEMRVQSRLLRSVSEAQRGVVYIPQHVISRRSSHWLMFMRAATILHRLPVYFQPGGPGCPLHDGLQLRQLVVHAQQPARVQEHHFPAVPLVGRRPHLLQQLVQGFAGVHRVQHDAW